MSEEAEAKAFDEWCPWGKLTQVRKGARAAWTQLYPEIAVRDSIIKAHLVELHRMDVLIEKALGWVRSLPHNTESASYAIHNLKQALESTPRGGATMNTQTWVSSLEGRTMALSLQKRAKEIKDNECVTGTLFFNDVLKFVEEYLHTNVALGAELLRKDQALEMEMHLRKLAVIELEELRPLKAELQRRAEQIKSMQKNMQRNYDQKDDAIQTLHTQKLEAETKLQKMMDQIKHLLREIK